MRYLDDKGNLHLDFFFCPSRVLLLIWRTVVSHWSQTWESRDSSFVIWKHKSISPETGCIIILLFLKKDFSQTAKLCFHTYSFRFICKIKSETSILLKCVRCLYLPATGVHLKVRLEECIDFVLLNPSTITWNFEGGINFGSRGEAH